MLRPVYYEPACVHSILSPEDPGFWAQPRDVFNSVTWYRGWEAVGQTLEEAQTGRTPGAWTVSINEVVPQALLKIEDHNAYVTAIAAWYASKPRVKRRVVVSDRYVFADWFPCWYGAVELQNMRQFTGYAILELADANPVFAKIQELVPIVAG